MKNTHYTRILVEEIELAKAAMDIIEYLIEEPQPYRIVEQTLEYDDDYSSYDDNEVTFMVAYDFEYQIEGRLVSLYMQAQCGESIRSRSIRSKGEDLWINIRELSLFVDTDEVPLDAVPEKVLQDLICKVFKPQIIKDK